MRRRRLRLWFVFVFVVVMEAAAADNLTPTHTLRASYVRPWGTSSPSPAHSHFPEAKLAFDAELSGVCAVSEHHQHPISFPIMLFPIITRIDDVR